MTQTPTFGADEFRKATRSQANQECVSVARRDGWVELRDDKLVDTPYYATVALRLREDRFDAYLDAVRAEDTAGHCIVVSHRDDGLYEFRDMEQIAGPALLFDRAEVDAFYDGVTKHEFDSRIAENR